MEVQLSWAGWVLAVTSSGAICCLVVAICRSNSRYRNLEACKSGSVKKLSTCWGAVIDGRVGQTAVAMQSTGGSDNRFTGQRPSAIVPRHGHDSGPGGSDESEQNAGKHTFVTNRKCPYAQRVWIALLESGIEFELIEVSLYGPGGKPEWFRKCSPRGQVPVLVAPSSATPSSRFPRPGVEGRSITESTAILDYISNLAPQLEPEDEEAAQEIQNFVDVILMPAGEMAYFNRCDGTAGLQAAISQLSSILSRSAGVYACGNRFSITDALLLPIVERLDELGDDVWQGDGAQRVAEWYAAASTRPSFVATRCKNHWWWW